MFKSLLLKSALALSMLMLPVAVLLYLVTAMPGASLQGALPAPDAEQQWLAGRLHKHVQVMADTVGPRHAQTPTALEQAADYLAGEFRSYGYTPELTYYDDQRFRNVSVTLRGNALAHEIIVIGAHYDSAASSGTPGADDNASGLAGMLEIARILAGRDFDRSIRFIAFTNEELPWFGTELMGSRVAAQQAAALEENITAMFSLEMIGYYSDQPGSQDYPPVIGNFYPDQGNFIAFVTNMGNRPLLHQALQAFRSQRTFPSEGMAAPQSLVADIRRSDNASYWDYGFPALMVTDTSNFRNPHYHTQSDTVDTLDYDSMTRVVQGLAGMLEELASGAEP